MSIALESIYRKFASPGLLEVMDRLKISTDFLIEAGCHDGSDTLQFLRDTEVKCIYAFEPDPVASRIALEKFKKYPNRVELKVLALLNKSGWASVFSPTGSLGDGSTIFKMMSVEEIENIGREKLIPVSTLDETVHTNLTTGALWLDVEGSAHSVLQGSRETLKKILVCQIEVDLHDISENRKSNFTKVHREMKANSFSLIYAPIHPGYFGDCIYLKKNQRTYKTTFLSIVVTPLYFALHLIVYPVLKKPK